MPASHQNPTLGQGTVGGGGWTSSPATGPANVPIHGGYPTPGQSYTFGTGFGITANQLGTITSAQLNSATLSLDNLTLDVGKREVDLPPISFRCEEDGKWFTLTLQPEHTMSPFECLLLTRLINAALPKSFNVIGFVRKNNLEKHFKFE